MLTYIHTFTYIHTYDLGEVFLYWTRLYRCRITLNLYLEQVMSPE